MILESLRQRKISPTVTTEILVATVFMPWSTCLLASGFTDPNVCLRPGGGLPICTPAPAVCRVPTRVLSNSFKYEFQATTESNLLHFLISLRISVEILELPIQVCYYEK